MQDLISTLVLFFVIFDPFASVIVFQTATQKLSKQQQRHIAFLSVGLALLLSLFFLFMGTTILDIFNTSLDEFRIAGGIILSLLGIRMAMGAPLRNLKEKENKSVWGIAAIIGTPLLTGPAAISAILVSRVDYGLFLTGISVVLVLAVTAIMLLFAHFIAKIGPVLTQILTTLLGMITLSWGVGMILTGLAHIF